MNMDELLDYLDGFQAWDEGLKSIGIHHPEKREEVKAYLLERLEKDPEWISCLLWKHIGRHAPNQLGAGSLEDIQGTMDWLREFLGFDDWSGL